MIRAHFFNNRTTIYLSKYEIYIVNFICKFQVIISIENRYNIYQYISIFLFCQGAKVIIHLVIDTTLIYSWYDMDIVQIRNRSCIYERKMKKV